MSRARSLRAIQARSRAAASDRIRPQMAAGGGYFGPTYAGVPVTPQTALSLTSVFSAINVISRDVATLPRIVYRMTKAGERWPDIRKPQHRLVNSRPNCESNAVRFFQALMAHMLGWGNGYAEITRDDWTGEPNGLWLLHPSGTRPERDANDQLYYQLDNGRTLPPSDVIHIAGLGFDGIQGYSPLAICRQAVGLGLALETFGATWFGNGSRAGGWIKHSKTLSDDAQRRLRESIELVHGGGPGNANRVGILEEGMEFQNTTIPPEDAQFLATRAFQVEEIARLYSIPPHKIGDYSKSHLANVEEANLDYITTTLAGHLEAMEAELDAKLFSELEQGGWFVEHDMSRLQRGNMTARGAYYRTMRDLGVFSANDIAARENMNPIPAALGGDKRLVQLALTTLERAGDPPPVAALPAPAPKPAEPPPPAAAEPDPQPEPDQADDSDQAEAPAVDTAATPDAEGETTE